MKSQFPECRGFFSKTPRQGELGPPTPLHRPSDPQKPPTEPGKPASAGPKRWPAGPSSGPLAPRRPACKRGVCQWQAGKRPNRMAESGGACPAARSATTHSDRQPARQSRPLALASAPQILGLCAPPRAMGQGLPAAGRKNARCLEMGEAPAGVSAGMG